MKLKVFITFMASMLCATALEIVLPEVPTVFEKTAAEELSLHLKNVYGDIPLINEADAKGGLAIYVGDTSLAKANGIPVQESVRSGGGTNGGMIHTEGVPCIVIGVPVRYIHSHHCWCTADDYEAAVELAVKICETVDEKVLAGF